MFLEICIQIHSVVFALSRQINKQKVCEKTINLLCADNKVFVSCASRRLLVSESPRKQIL